MQCLSRRLSIACAVALLVSPLARPALALPAPPAGMRSIDGNGGGTILDGSLPNASSTGAAFRAGLARARAYFGSTARLAGVVRSNDGSLTLGLFKASLDGSEVGGFVLTTFVPHGTSRVDVLFDRVDRVQQTMRGLIAQTESLHPAGAAAGSGPSSGAVVANLHDVTSPDGSVRVKLADGWHPGIFAQGSFAAAGPDSAEVDQEVVISCNDPRGPLGRNAPNMMAYYSPSIVQSYQNAWRAMEQRGATPTQTTFSSVEPESGPPGTQVAKVAGTAVVKGVTRRFQGFLRLDPPNQYGGWSIDVKMISAPEARYAADLPTLAAIYNSYNVDQRVRNGQVAETIQDDQAGMARGAAMMAQTRARNEAVFNASMSHAAAVQSSIDRSTSGFVHYLNDTTVVEGPGGARGTADSGFAQSIANADPANFRIVPVGEYRPGD